MTSWNHDLSAAPKDGTDVILAMRRQDGRYWTLRSYWVRPKKDPEHWVMLSHLNQPIAWAPWPTYDAAPADPIARLDSINHQFMAALDGVGSGA